ncbi:MAG: ABC transporter permease [Terriglobales bacterium]
MIRETIGEASRVLWRRPRYTITAALLLGLGVGVVAAAFAIVHAVLLRPLPYKHAARLVVAMGEVRAGDYADIQARSHALAETTLVGMDNGILRLRHGMRQVSVLRVSPNFFSMMGIAPATGRAFEEDDFANYGAGTALASCGLQSLPVGGTITLNSKLYTVVGTVPCEEDFTMAWPNSPAAVWLPLTLTQAQLRARGVTQGPVQGTYPFYTFLVGRLRRGVTLRRAQGDLDGVMRDLIAQHPEDAGLRGLQLWGLSTAETRPDVFGAMLWPLFALALALLGIAGMNVAGLTSACWLGREREVAIRMALGATPGRIALLPMAEGGLVGLIGFGLGAALAYWGVALIRASLPSASLPRIAGIVLGWPVLGFAAVVSVLTGCAAGAVSVLVRRRREPAVMLARSSPFHGAPVRWVGAGGALVFVQSAAATALLGLAGMTLGGAWRLSHAPLGFDPQQVIELDAARASTAVRAWEPAENVGFLRSALARAVSMPGVAAAALAGTSFGYAHECSFAFPGKGAPASGKVSAYFVSPGYFKVLRIPLLAGRDFNDQDGLGAPQVAVVNEGFAHDYLGGGALGQAVEVRTDLQDRAWRRAQIVGVVRGNAMSGTWRPSETPAIYLSVFQSPVPGAVLFARVVPGAFRNPEQFAVAFSGLDSGLLVRGAKTLRQDMAEVLRMPLFLSQWAAVLAVLALLLAYAGVYGVASVYAQAKRRDLAIRSALGAGRAHLLGTAVRQAAIYGGGGTACGVLIAEAMAGTARAWVFGLKPASMAAAVAAAAAMLVACVSAALLAATPVLKKGLAELLRGE